MTAKVATTDKLECVKVKKETTEYTSVYLAQKYKELRKRRIAELWNKKSVAAHFPRCRLSQQIVRI